MSTLPDNIGAQRSTAWFCGQGAVSGVGSLPFTAAEPAIAFVARWCPELPFWPQLRRMSPREAMIPQTFGRQLRHLVALKDECAYGVRGERVGRFVNALERADARLDPENAAGFYAFIDALEEGRFSGARAVKGQVMGPVTVACSLLVDGTPFVDRAELRNPVADYVVRLASWQVETLLRYSPSVVIVLDEAYLGVALRQRPERRAFATDLLKEVILRVRRPGVLVGLHCCDELPLSLLNEVGLDLYSFDAFHGGDAFAGSRDAKSFVAGGGHVAWGWVPTLDDLGRIEPAALAGRWWDATRALSSDGVADPERIRCRSLVTASCGLAGSSAAVCERSFEIAREVSRRYTQRAQDA